MSLAATGVRWFAAAVASYGAMAGQVLSAAAGAPFAVFRHLGHSSFAAPLAGPATGAVSALWYSRDGGTLFARTASGRIFQTADFENWMQSSAAAASRPDGASRFTPLHQPDPQARVFFASGNFRRLWSLGRDLLASDDNGATWTNLSGAGESVIGDGQRDVAIRPAGDSAITVANDWGIWQSVDDGRSWSGLNENLPNLPVARILSTNPGSVRIALNDGRVLQLADARSPWTMVGGENALTSDARERGRLGGVLGADITAVTHGGEFFYAGSSDGKLWTSRDRGATWTLSQASGRGPVERIVIDGEAPRAALALLSGPGAHIFRTVNGGAVWDDVSGTLADVSVNGIAADRASSTAFVATDHGVFTARLDLNAFVPASAWTPFPGSLPFARPVDVALDPHGRQLFVAMEGYGLYAAALPVHGGALRVLNAADFSTRPAAPGSLITLSGGKVTGARSGDLRFPVLAAADGESQLQVPFEVRTAATVDLAVDLAAASPAPKSAVVPLAVRGVSPAIFVDADGDPFLVDADSGLALDPASAAHPNARLELMATGLGRVQPDWPTGVPAPSENPPSVVSSLKAYLDGVPLAVTKSTLAPGYVGYYLVEVQLPAILNAGPAELYLTADGQESNRVRVTVDAQARTE